MTVSVCGWFILFAISIRGTDQGSSERRLYRELLKDYNPLERPVENDSLPLTVSFSISLQQLLDVDERDQMISTNIWLRMNWRDHYLQWNESDYPGVKNIRFHTNQLWIPDVLLYNSADDGFDSTFKTHVLVNSSGHCTFIPPGIFTSSCTIDVRWFPFDVQKCELKFGSWTYDGWLLDLRMEEADTSGFIPNGEWDLIGVPGQRNVIYYECCQAPYPDVTFHIIIRRRTLYYALNLLIPCVLLSCMALLVFILPAESGEKISLGITVLLSLTVFMLLVAEIMPATSDSIPLIGLYFASIVVMVGVSVIATVFVLQYHYHKPSEGTFPKWVRIVLLQWCAWFLRMKRPGAQAPRPTCQPGPRRRSSESERVPAEQQAPNGNLVYLGFRGLKDIASPYPGPRKADLALGPSSYLAGPNGGLVAPCWVPEGDPQLGRILQELEYLAGRLREQDEEDSLCNEWRFAAAVLDRMCLVTFALLNIVSTISILMSAPNFVEAVSKDYL